MQTGRATTEVIARVVGYVAVILATKAAPATFLHEDIEGQVRKKPLNPVPVRDLAASDPVLILDGWQSPGVESCIPHSFAMPSRSPSSSAPAPPLAAIAPPLPQRGTLP